MLRRLWWLTVTDLRAQVRNRSVLIFGLIVPAALIAVMHLVFGSGQAGAVEPEATVAVSADGGDPIVAAVEQAYQGLSIMQVTTTHTDADGVRTAVGSGATLGLIFPADFGAALTSGREATVTVVRGDDGGTTGIVLESVLHSVLDEVHRRGELAAAAGAAGVDPAVVLANLPDGPRLTLTEGAVSDEQLSANGALIAGQAGLFLLFTVGFGMMSLAVERSQGTLARLNSMPMPGWLVVAGKALSSFVIGVGATSVLVFGGAAVFGVDFGPPGVVLVLILAVVAAATSLMFVLGKVTRTPAQANVAQSIVALVLGVAGGAFFPLAVSGWVSRLLDLNPVAAFSRGLGISSGGGGLDRLGVPLLTMLGFAVVCVLVGALVPNRGEDR